MVCDWISSSCVVCQTNVLLEGKKFYKDILFSYTKKLLYIFFLRCYANVIKFYLKIIFK